MTGSSEELDTFQGRQRAFKWVQSILEKLLQRHKNKPMRSEIKLGETLRIPRRSSAGNVEFLGPDAYLERMQTDADRNAGEYLFRASSEELGEAAVAEALGRKNSKR